jgi:predicted MFS family arabinose efflux permease
MQATYGGFLFVFTLHLEAGLGESPMRAGLTYLPLGAAFGLVGFYWRKLPERIHHALAPIGLAMCVLAYLGISADGSLMWIALVAAGVGMGLSVSPLLTQSLVHVPLSQVADASGLLTTTMQLGQVVGVAVGRGRPGGGAGVVTHCAYGEEGSRRRATAGQRPALG